MFTKSNKIKKLDKAMPWIRQQIGAHSFNDMVKQLIPIASTAFLHIARQSK